VPQGCRAGGTRGGDREDQKVREEDDRETTSRPTPRSIETLGADVAGPPISDCFRAVEPCQWMKITRLSFFAVVDGLNEAGCSALS
jgi:hypothetical protein